MITIITMLIIINTLICLYKVYKFLTFKVQKFISPKELLNESLNRWIEFYLYEVIEFDTADLVERRRWEPLVFIKFWNSHFDGLLTQCQKFQLLPEKNIFIQSKHQLQWKKIFTLINQQYLLYSLKQETSRQP